jgi:hypothetical protein
LIEDDLAPGIGLGKCRNKNNNGHKEQQCASHGFGLLRTGFVIDY